MPFLISESKEASAVLNVLKGFFLDSKTPNVIFACGRVLSLFKYVKDEMQPKLIRVQDFKLNCVLKYVQAVPLVNPESNNLYRHVLFILSVKQEISIIALSGMRKEISLLTLFHSAVDSCFYQYYPGEVDLACSTTFDTGVTEPLVAFGINRGDIFVVDVLAAIGSSMNNTTKSYLPSSLVHLAEERTAHGSYSRCTFDLVEYEVRDIAFGKMGSSSDPVLFVLYADAHGRTHVSIYTFSNHVDSLGRSSEPQTYGSSLVHVQGAVTARDGRISRRGVLVSNADPSAAKIISLSTVVAVIGSQLLTLVAKESQHVHPITDCFPPGIEFSCACKGKDDEIFVFFKDGYFLHTDISKVLNHNKSLKLLIRRLEVPTFPTSITHLDRTWLVIGSRLGSSLLFDYRVPSSFEVVVKNCGPVMDMTVIEQGTYSTVVASTGTGPYGGISIVRSSASFIEKTFDLSLAPRASKVFCARHLVVLSTSCGSTFYSSTNHKMRQPSRIDLANPFPGYPVVHLSYNASTCQYLLVYACGACSLVEKPREFHLVAVHEWSLGSPVSFASTVDDCLVISDGYQLVEVRELKELWMWRSEECLSALLLLSTELVVYGDWSSRISIYSLVQHAACGGVTLSSVPRSICSTWHAGSDIKLFVGLVSGYAVETSLELLKNGSILREIFLMHRPVECVPLKAYNCLVCLGEWPILIRVSEKNVQLTSLPIPGLSDICVLGEAEEDAVLVVKENGSSVAIGDLEHTQKVNFKFLELQCTVTHLAWILPWSGFVVSLRGALMDRISFIPLEALECPTMMDSKSLVHQGVLLLENERCVFIEPLSLGFSNETDVNNESVYQMFPDRFVVLVGSTFTFPDEQIARSSRITWYQLTEGRLLRHVADKDIVGQLQCCCIVPHYPGRIALGISGCVCIYQWDKNEETFMPEEKRVIGMIIIKLVPLYDCQMQNKHVIVALDVRYSAFFLSVDPLQGSIEILKRDPQLRGIMDGAITDTGELCMCDDHMNFYCVQQESGDHNRLATKAQCHLGDLVTCMRIGTLALPTLQENCTPSIKSLLPGVSGRQMVYGTAHGAFGIITPITRTAYVFMKSLEVAMHHHLPSLGGFSPKDFSEVMHTGQEKSHNRNISFFVGRNCGKDLSRARETCDGNTIEAFLTLERRGKRHVLEIAQRITLALFDESAASFTDPDELTGVPSKSRASEEDDIIDRCNHLLANQNLPRLPYEVSDIEQLIFDLQRIH
ncbi:unnamed protein product [Phytomonas sp. EM1]|nr:unnamed protein product [Phytomonas sp. EM1]|eukprot:CCW61484.1 unnamed protein product [Phytomonas sp. isolate EM1]